MAHLVIVERFHDGLQQEPDRIAINADRILKVEPTDQGITITLIIGAGTKPGDTSRFFEVEVAEDLDAFVNRLT